jgi:hypothetical protein
MLLIIKSMNDVEKDLAECTIKQTGNASFLSQRGMQ